MGRPNDRTSADEAKATRNALSRLRLKIAFPDGYDDSLTDSEVARLLAEIEAERHEHPAWLHLPRGAFGEPFDGDTAVEVTARWLIGCAHLVEGAPAMLLGALASDAGRSALYDTLVNAASHTPEFSRRSDTETLADPYGCVACGGVDGVGACDTWESGIALTKALFGDLVS